MFTNKLFLLSIGVIFSVLVIPFFADAAYTPLANGLQNLETDNLGGFFNNLFEVALTIGAVLAVLIIAVSGLQYMTTEAASGKGSSKERIQQAILGLLMLLSVWLFFSEINPDILNLDFSLNPVNVTVTNSTTTTGSTDTARTPGDPLNSPNILENYTDETWTRMPSGETCGSVKGAEWEEVREYRCPGVSPYGADTRDCCALNPNYSTDAYTNGTIYPLSESRNLPSGSWCYPQIDASGYNITGYNCLNGQDTCVAAHSSDTSSGSGSCGQVQ